MWFLRPDCATLANTQKDSATQAKIQEDFATQANAGKKARDFFA
jgi:hypothetical protein